MAAARPRRQLQGITFKNKRISKQDLRIKMPENYAVVAVVNGGLEVLNASWTIVLICLN